MVNSVLLKVGLLNEHLAWRVEHRLCCVETDVLDSFNYPLLNLVGKLVEVEVTLLVYPGGREPWYLAYSGPFGGKPPYGWRMWIEEGFRGLKGQGFGLDRHRLRTGASLRGWLWLLALGMALLILLGARLQGREWLPRLLAHPERQSLFRLGRIALAQGPPPWREAVVEELIRLLQELGGGK